MHIYFHTFDDQHPSWPTCQAIRQRVFVEEQHVPIALEWDAADATAVHILAVVDAQAVACARVLPDGHIGRMAVLPAWRGKGIGSALLMHAITQCRALGVDEVRLSAQKHAIAFYEGAGFDCCSAPYVDANILHVDMRLKLV